MIFDAVVLADAVALFLQPSDTLDNLDQALFAARLREALAQLGQPLLEALGKARDDASTQFFRDRALGEGAAARPVYVR